MSELTVADLYAEGLDRVLALGSELADADADVRTAACPEWTVRDVFAHLAAIPTDAMAGRIEGSGTDPWTARQVEERRGRTLAENLAELAEAGPRFVEALRDFPVDRVVIDQWTHEQDVRGALGRPGSRDVAAVAWTVEQVMSRFDAGRRKHGLVPLRFEVTSGTWTVGEGAPVATVRTTDFELLRGLLGRRSPAQVRSWVVDGDRDAVDGLAFFGPRDDDLVE